MSTLYKKVIANPLPVRCILWILACSECKERPCHCFYGFHICVMPAVLDETDMQLLILCLFGNIAKIFYPLRFSALGMINCKQKTDKACTHRCRLRGTRQGGNELLCMEHSLLIILKRLSYNLLQLAPYEGRCCMYIIYMCKSIVSIHDLIHGFLEAFVLVPRGCYCF